MGINLVAVADGAVIQRLDLTATGSNIEIGDVAFDAKLQLLGYREDNGSVSSVHYVDLAQAQTADVRIDQDFDHPADIPEDNANFAWAADGSRIAIVGLQNATTSLHVAELGDASGASVEISLPEVESAQGITIDHIPRVSPDGTQAIVWYRAQDGRTGLLHAPMDGSGEGQVVLGLEHALREGAFLQHVPE